MEVKKLLIEKIVSNGAGLARDRGRVVFVPFTVPGETVKVRIIKKEKDYSTGIIEEIIEPSPERTDPLCPLYMKCGGCSLQHISGSAQEKIIKNLTAEASFRNGRVELKEIGTVSGKPFSYRNRVQFHPDYSGRPGFFTKGGEGVIPVGFCPVCTEGINSFAKDPETRISGKTVVFSPGGPGYFSGGPDCSADSAGGKKEIEVRLGNKIFFTGISCFFQSNITMFEKVLYDIRDEVLPGGTVLDLYGGTGVIGGFVSDKAEKVVSVEADKNASVFAEKNIKLNSFEDRKLITEIYQVRAEVFARYGHIKKLKPRTIIADPPRSGISPLVRNSIAEAGPEKFLYLSCCHATFGRDLGFFAGKGFEIESVRVYSFYPQTEHAEILAVLRFRL